VAKLRAFIGLALEEPALGVAARCLEELRSSPLGRDARFVRPEGLHVTLRFLGAIESEAVPALAGAVAASVFPLAPFPVRLGQIHAFPSPRRPRVLALGLEPEARLAELAAAVERGVVAAGFAPEPRPFRAHVTLARVFVGRRLALEGLPGPAPAQFTAREATLFESRPGAGGSLYTPVERMTLGGPVFTQP
jgi:2'-5' RNA ligase